MFAWEYMYTWEMSSTNRLHLNKISYYSPLLLAVHLPTFPCVILGITLSCLLMGGHGLLKLTSKTELSECLT